MPLDRETANAGANGSSANGRGAPIREVAIIGAGIAGLCMAIELRKAAITDFVVIEKEDAVGGTWLKNTYPGAACDIPAQLYSFSFELKTDWSCPFAGQEEILQYLQHCTTKYGVRPHLRLGCSVEQAVYDEDAGYWRLRVRSRDGIQTIRARSVVSGVGQLGRPKLPRVPGRDRFEGPSFHSARFDHDVDLADKRVGVVGNGASAVQLVPEIAPTAREVTVFQRSAHWVIPRFGRARSALEHTLLEHVPGLARAMRVLTWAKLEAFWPLIVAHQRRVLRPLLERLATAFMELYIKDPALREALTPDHQLGCKRVLHSDAYYPALTRPDVRLVPEALARVTEKGVRTEGGTECALDVLIYCTGFHSGDFLAPMEVRGRGGLRLSDVWAEGAEAYLGMAVPQFPNLYFLYGPNTNLGHNSIVFMIEQQARYVRRCIETRRQRGLKALEVREEAMQRWQKECRARLERTVWASGCNSWFQTGTAGRISNNWPYSTIAYWRRTRTVDFSDYHEHRSRVRASRSDRPRAMEAAT